MFRKITAFIMAIVMLFSFSICAFADMGAPPFKTFSYTIEDPDGVELYDNRWENEQSYMDYYTTAPKGTVLTITGEYSTNGKVYGSVEYNNNYLYIDMANVHLDGEFVYPTEEDKFYDEFSLVVINPDGASLRNGPSHAYDASLTVPYGSTFDVVYSDGAWAYVEYDGTKGWIHYYPYDDSYDCAYVLSTPGKLMVVQDDTVITETPDRTSAVLAKDIPYGTVLSYKYRYSIIKSSMVFVEYNGIRGWMETNSEFGDGAASENESYIAITEKNGLEIYEKALDKSNSIGKVPYNVLLCPEFMLGSEFSEGECWFYIVYNNIKGWISARYDQYVSSYYNMNKYKVDSGTVPVYTERDTSSTQLFEFKQNDTFTAYIEDYNYESQDTWMLVSNDEYCGWAYKETNLTDAGTENISYNLPTYTLIGTKIESVDLIPDKSTKEEINDAPVIGETTTAKKTEKKEEKSEKDEIAPNKLVVVCIAAAVIVAATAVAIILVVKKSKKNNNHPLQ